MDPEKEYYQITAKKIIKSFKKRGIDGYYCSNGSEAVSKALELINDGSSVSWGGSMTLQEIGLFKELKERDLELLDRSTAKNAEEKREIYYQALNCDYYLMSSNAVTQDGKLINVDGNGNRIAALIYGPKNVIVIAGMNKVCIDEESAMKRVRNYAAPMNAIRLDQKTPCTKAGSCQECLVDYCICCQLLVTRKSGTKGRIKVILVGEKLGY